MPIRRLIVEIDVNMLTFADMHEVGGAVATLERYARLGTIELQALVVAGSGTRKQRSDAKNGADRHWMGKQTKKVLDVLSKQSEPIVATELARQAQIPENSIRAQLTALAKHGLAETCGVGGMKPPSGRVPKLWRATEVARGHDPQLDAG